MTPFEIKCITELQVILENFPDTHKEEHDWISTLADTEVTETLGDSASATLGNLWFDRGQFE